VWVPKGEITPRFHDDDVIDPWMLTFDQDKPTAAVHTVEDDDDVSGLDVSAITTAVDDVQLPPGPISEDVQAEDPCGTSKGPIPLSVAEVGTFSPAFLEGRPGSMVLAGSAGSAHSEDSPPRWAGVALRNARAELFAEMQDDADPRGRYYPSLEWRDLPAKLPLAWEQQVLYLDARRAGGFLSRHTHALRQEEFNGVILEHRMAVDEIFSGVLKSNAWRFAREEEDHRRTEKRDA
jgi:hypothetical protein